MLNELTVIPCDHKAGWPGKRCPTCGEFKLTLKYPKREQPDLTFLEEEELDQERWSKGLSKELKKKKKGKR